MAKPVTVTFEHIKDTKNKHRFEEVENNQNSDEAIGALYVHKDVYGGNPPARITVSIIPAE